MRVVEAFSGIGSQAKALKNIGINPDIVATIEWDINAIYAYDIIHNGKQDLSEYEGYDREKMVELLSQYNLSNNGKDAMKNESFKRYPLDALKRIYHAIIRTNNLVDIQKVKAGQLPNNIDLFTYSFPCQDLSLSGSWHGNNKGINREAKTRSGLLWEVERILKEFNDIGKKKPRFLLMENVSNILSKTHIKDFNEWKDFLNENNYMNQVYTLESDNFGVPQKRKRTYMISVHYENELDKEIIKAYFKENNLESRKMRDLEPLEKYLRLDYNNHKYFEEALKNNPNNTESRQKILDENDLIHDGKRVVLTPPIVRTITTKQDRNPNSGVIRFKTNDKEKSDFRYLTPREAFMLMGFEEEDYQRLVDNDFMFNKARSFYGVEKLHKLAGNSIVVPVLEEIFKQIVEIEGLLKIKE